MKNLFRHEIFKLLKSKSFWVVLIVAASVSLFIAIIMQSVGGTTVELGDGETTTMAFTKGAEGLMFAASDASVMIVFISILVSGIFCSEYQKGIIRNLVTSGAPRWKIYITKLILCTVASLILLVVMTVIFTGFCTVFNGFGSVNFGKLMLSLLTIVIHVVAISALIVFIADLTKSTGATIGISIGIYLLFTIIIQIVGISATGTWLKVVEFFSDIHPGKGMEVATNLDISIARYIRLIIMAICSTAVFTFGGMFLFKKRDLK